jgi:A/G-specific adenine glycosylase
MASAIETGNDMKRPQRQAACASDPDRDAPDLSERLLAWYDGHARRLPWRAPPRPRPGAPPSDPYIVWLSEIMLQQTTVVSAAPYFERFLARWPDVRTLAAAPLEDVLTLWSGLGYYARARNLHRCARKVAGELGGRFPDSEERLRELPGVGPYTAAAIAAIAFDQRATAVDGNIERVICRLFAIEEPLPAAKTEIRRVAERLTPGERCGDYTQAMMDLGATICSPRAPKCMICPLRGHCRAHAEGDAETLPRRAPKAERPTRRAVAFLVRRGDGALFLRRRPEEGLLGGMMEVPSTPWREARWDEREVLAAAPFDLAWRTLPGSVRHTFTHFHLEATLWAGRLEDEALAGVGRWVSPESLQGEALPTVMRKLIRHGLAGARD